MRARSEYRGETHHAAKVSERTIKQMKELRKAGWLGKEIAAEFGVCRDTVYRLTNDKGRVK